MSDDVDDKFKPVHAAELTDERGLYGEFRAFRSEMRTALELLTLQLLQLLKRQGEKIDDLEERAADHDQRIAALESRPRRKR